MFEENEKQDGNEKKKGFLQMSNEVFDTLKWLTMLGIPATTVFYVALAAIWNFPYADEIAKTSAALVAFMAALLQISTNQFNARQ